MASKEKGFVLALVLFIMVILSLIGMLGLFRINRGASEWGAQRRNLQAFHIAEAGIYRAVAELNDNINWNPGGPFTEDFRNGRYTVTRADVNRNIVPPGGSSLQNLPVIELISVGTLTGLPAPETPTVTLRAIGLKVGYPPPMFEFAIFSSQNVTLDANNRVNGGNVYSGATLTISVDDAIVGGSASAYDDVLFARGAGSIRNGSVYAGDDVNLTDQSRVRVNGGSVYAGDMVSGVPPYSSQVVGGSVYQGVPSPVQPVSYYQNNYKMDCCAAGSEFAHFYSRAQSQGHLLLGNQSISGGNYTGIWYITGDLHISGDFSGDAIFVVEGNLYLDGNIRSTSGQTYAFIVNGNVDTRGLGRGSIDAFVYANGAIDAFGNSTVNGGVVSFGGVTGHGGFTVNYRTPTQVSEIPGYSEKFKIISLEKP